MTESQLRIHGVPASTLLSSLPLSSEDKAFCLDCLERLQQPDLRRREEAYLELERQCGELIITAIALQTVLKVCQPPI